MHERSLAVMANLRTGNFICTVVLRLVILPYGGELTRTRL